MVGFSCSLTFIGAVLRVWFPQCDFLTDAASRATEDIPNQNRRNSESQDESYCVCVFQVENGTCISTFQVDDGTFSGNKW